MKKRLLITMILLAFLCVPVTGGAVDAPSASQVGQQSLQAIQLRAQDQKQREEYLKREGGLLDQIEAAKRELKRVSQHRAKTEAYVQNQRQKLAETKRRIAEAEKIKVELDPLLDRTWQSLQERDAARAPWDRAVATVRMQDIKRVLDDYDAGLAAKTLAVLSELRQRAQEVSRVQVSETELEIEGRILRVQLMRLGGLGWYALSMDGKQAWLWESGPDAFKPIPDYAGQLDQALEIAQRQRVVNLVELPLAPGLDGGAGSAAKEGGND